MNTKRIKGSERGITFCTDTAVIGQKYRYIVDTKNQTINIIPDEEGNITVSKKKSGKKIRPLFDLRSKEVKKLIQNSEYMEIEEHDENIIVKVFKKNVLSNIRLFRAKTCTIQEVLGQQIGEIVIPKNQILMATGTDGINQPTMWFGRPTLYNDNYFEYLSSQASSYFKTQNKPKKEDIKTVYDIVSLFSGGGLFDKAWLDGGRFRFVYGVDFCKDVIETYEKNIGKHIVCKDIRDVEPQEIPYADVYSASPCCQAYSNANRHNIASDAAEEKRLLIDDPIRLVITNRPKVLVVENVPQLLTKDNGMYYQRVIDGLTCHGYEITAKVLTDYEVGGYTMRKRAIIIASRIGKIELPDVKVVTTATVKDALSKIDASWVNYNDITTPSKDTEEKMSYVRPGHNYKDIPEMKDLDRHSNVYRRLDNDDVAPTITNYRKVNLIHPTLNRGLSVAEAAALMGLNKDFTFYGKLSDMQQMVANGVTQAIGKLVKNAVVKKLDESLANVRFA